METNKQVASQSAILLAGGAGYIGSHILLEILRDKDFSNFHVIVVDNFSNSTPANFNVIRTKLADLPERLHLVGLDLASELGVRQFEKNVLEKYDIQVVVHLAGYKSVKQSVENPLDYYSNNLKSTINLLQSLKKYCWATPLRLVFSSSATVYGEGATLPIKETDKQGSGPINPYGQTKHMIEQILRDQAHHSQGSIWQICCLRYFNPIGVDSTGLLKEESSTTPENLIPYILRVLSPKHSNFTKLKVFGNNYSTPDGTCLRDYIHITDLAQAHLAAITSNTTEKFQIINVGTGKGYSVLEVIKEFERQNVIVPWEFVSRRPGDAPKVYANVDRAKEVLNWSAKYDLPEMVRDALLSVEN